MKPSAIVLAFLVVSRSAFAVEFQFQNPDPGALFQNRSNWLPDFFPDPPFGPPGAADTAIFGLGQTHEVSFDGDVTNSRLIVRDGDVGFDLGGFDFFLSGPGTAAPSLVVGDIDGPTAELRLSNGGIQGVVGQLATSGASSGSLTIFSNATASFSDVFNLGVRGTGTLHVDANGLLSSNTGIVASQANSTGTANLVGGEWKTTGLITVGRAGNANLEVTEGGLVQAGSVIAASLLGSRAYIVVKDDESKWNIGDSLTLGREGHAQLSIEEGGSVANRAATLASMPGSEAAVLVTGQGSRWTNNDLLTIGRAGHGELTIEKEGSVLGRGMVIGSLQNAVGQVTVRDLGSSMSSDSIVDVGGGGQGNLQVIDGGLFEASEIYVARSSTGAGEVQVLGKDARISVAEDFNVGYGGFGTLRVENGGSVNIGNYLSLGDLENGFGLVVIDGNGSSVNAGQTYIGGLDGDGEVRVLNGGYLRTTYTPIGYQRGVRGDVVVSGQGSLWECGHLDVGAFGTGTLTISDRGQVTARTTDVGGGPFAWGELRVEGSGTKLTNTEYLRVGRGTVEILNGAVVEGKEGYLGQFSDSEDATVLIRGAGSRWSMSETLQIGNYGRSEIRVEEGGVLDTAGAFIGAAAIQPASIVVEGTDSRWLAGYLYLNCGDLTVGEDAVVDADYFLGRFPWLRPPRWRHCPIAVH
ncbi:MAG: hypothetical protein U1D30_25545 [Planctomycetota bacterium]